MSVPNDKSWQEMLSQLAKDWGAAEIDLMNEAMADLYAKFNKKRENIIGKTALVVEDSPMLRMMLEELLTKAGIKVTARAENGYEAVKLFNSENRFDFVFLNVTMPELDGIEALSDLKKDRGSIIIMVTSTMFPELVMQSVKNGAHHVLYRPFDFGMLMRIMCSTAWFSPEAYDAVVKRMVEMGKTFNLDSEMTQKEVFELEALCSSFKRKN